MLHKALDEYVQCAYEGELEISNAGIRWHDVDYEAPRAFYQNSPHKKPKKNTMVLSDRNFNTCHYDVLECYVTMPRA